MTSTVSVGIFTS